MCQFPQKDETTDTDSKIHNKDINIEKENIVEFVNNRLLQDCWD
jgi:hypothetical protein